MSRLKPYRLGPPYGGVNKQLAEHILADNVATITDNFTVASKGLKTVNGWEKFTTQVLTDGAASPTDLIIYKIDQFFKNDGTSYLIAFTNKAVYLYDETNTDTWLPITPGSQSATTVDQDSSSGTTTLYVASTTGYTAGDTIIINEGGAREEEAVVDSVSAGVSLTVLANLTYTHTLADADVVRRTYGVAIVDADSSSGQAVLNVSHSGQFSANEAVIVGLGTARAEIGTISSISAGVSITLDDNLSYTHTSAQADKVYRVKDLVLSNDVTDVDTDNNNNTYYFTDGVNAVQTWDATGAPTFHSNLSGLESGDDVVGVGTLTNSLKAKYIRAFEGFLVVGHVTEEGSAIPNKIRWSRINEPTKWANNTDGTGQAGSFLFSGADFILGMHQLKRELLIYRERSIEAMSYIGLPNVFGFRRAETGTGLVSPGAIADFGDKHVFVGPDNVWEYNGISLVAIGDPIKDEFFDVVDPSQLNSCELFFLEETDELWLTYSTSGNRVHDKGFVYNTLLRKWSGPRDVDATGYGYYRQQADETWDSISGTWDTAPAITWDSRSFLSNAPLNLMGNDDGLVFKLDQIGTKDGSTISKRYESKRVDMKRGDLLKTVQRIRVGLDVTSSASVEVYLGVAFSENDSITWKGPYSLTASSGYEPYVYFDEYGRYFKVRVDTDDSTIIEDIELHYYYRSEI